MDETFAKTANFSIDSKGHLEAEFADITQAIHIVQEEMGITGTTALEAGRTISGSVGAMKSAWSNLITGLADGNADIGKLVDNLVTTIVGDGTESNLGVLGNVMPAVKTALSGASRLVSELLPKIVQEIPSIINDNLPVLAEAAISIIQSLVDGISDNQEMLMTTAIDTLAFLNASFLSMLPQLVKVGLEMLVSFIKGMTDNIPMLIETAVNVVFELAEALTDPKQISELLDAALELLTEFAYGLMDAIPELVDAAMTIVESLVDFIHDPQNMSKILQAALEIVLAIGTGLVKSIPRLIESALQIVSSLTQSFRQTDWSQIGSNIVSGIWDGLRRMWGSLTSWFSDAWENLVGSVKDFLGIKSPSRVFASIGENMALGVGKGWDDEFGDIQGDIDKSLSFDDASIGITSSIRKAGAGAAGMAYGGTSIGNINITVNGAKYSDEQSLASAIAMEIQNMTDRRAAVYA